MTISQSDLYPLIAKQEPFKAGNVFAKETNGLYTVFSYGEHFPLAIKEGPGWRYNADRYSRSTSRQQQRLQLERLPNSEVCSTELMLSVLQHGSYEHRQQQILDRVTARLKE